LSFWNRKDAGKEIDLSELEREDGVLLVDFGAGCTEYVVEYDSGVCASGVLQLGMEHVANDLAIGLGLGIDQCRRLLVSGELQRAAERGETTLRLRGGALFSRTREIFGEVFDLSCRIAQPRDAEGAITDLASPRYSAVWGALKIAAHYRRIDAANEGLTGGFLSSIENKLGSIFGRGKIGKAFKF